jgi:hypothetical protein
MLRMLLITTQANKRVRREIGFRLGEDHNLEEASDGGGYVSRSRALRSQNAVTGRFRKNDRHKLRDQGLKIADTNGVILLLATP